MRIRVEPDVLEHLHNRVCQLAKLEADLLKPEDKEVRDAIGEAEDLARRTAAELERILRGLPGVKRLTCGVT